MQGKVFSFSKRDTPPRNRARRNRNIFTTATGHFGGTYFSVNDTVISQRCPVCATPKEARHQSAGEECTCCTSGLLKEEK